ncbi:transcriptional regulator [Sphaerisporangium rufum]|uniref:Transcriptional regulator n=2 Tax=Sphaerisporangium rufum TaxID=1381558 RepID=A0A919QZB0_9ACTN|nr:transcriptional regulator [Sphaerisporangium rufum]
MVGMSLRVALLGLLSFAGPASGYDLTKMFTLTINHVWQAKHSQIYPELNRMAADGLISVAQPGPRGRKIYTITEHGAATMRDWLVSHTPSGTMRSEQSLQAFLLPLLEPPQALEALERMADATQARLDGLEEMKKVHMSGQGGGDIGHYALDLGIMQLRAILAWTHQTADDIRASAAPDS